LPKVSIEDSKTEEVAEEARNWQARRIVEWTESYWKQHHAAQWRLSMSEFVSETIKCWKTQIWARVDWQVKQYLRQWTDRRQELLTDALEELDRMKTLRGAQSQWEVTLGSREFKEVELAAMLQKTREIRAHCMRGKEYSQVVERILKHIYKWTNARGQLVWGIEPHRALYEDSKKAILETMKSQSWGDLRFEELITRQSIDEEGCTHSEYRVYRVW
jgi:hypothetical protein